MLKQSKSFTAKVKQIRRGFGDLQYNFCDVLVKFDNKFFVENHRKSKQHQGKLETKSKSQNKQTFLQLDQVNF